MVLLKNGCMRMLSSRTCRWTVPRPPQRVCFPGKTAFFPEKDGKTCDIIDLPVGVGLRKIRVGGQVQHGIRVDGPFQITARF